MKKIDIGQTINTLANFGVVLGIIFLAIELRQNQALMQREFDLQVVDGLKLIADSADEIRKLHIENREISELWSDGLEGRALDPIDTRRWNSLCEMNVWNSAVLYERNRVLGETEITQAMAMIVRNSRENQPATDACWNSQEDALRVWGLGEIFDASSARISNEE